MGRNARAFPFLVAAALVAAPVAFCQAPAAAAAHSASLLDQSAAPPVLDYSGGQLTIRATNSSLRTILDKLQAMTGTRIDGLTKDERIFGVYGPGNPQEVLSSLLDSSGYNVLIDGVRPDGAPREIVLSTEAPADATPQPATVTQAAAESDDSDTEGSTPFGMVPPQPTPPPGPADHAAPQLPQQVRTPQQMLEELQRMRQQAAQGSNPQ